MTRDLGANVEAAVASGRAERVHLYELEYSNGVLYLTDAGNDISWNGNTYVALGGTMAFEGVQETTDRKAQGVPIHVTGVDQTVIATLLNNHFRGREAIVRVAYLDMEAGAILDDPVLLFQGVQNGRYEIEETRHSELGDGAVDISTTAGSRIARLRESNSVRANVASHMDMLRRAGLDTVEQDNFFSTVAGLANRAIYWGRESPRRMGAVGGTMEDDRGHKEDRDDRI